MARRSGTVSARTQPSRPPKRTSRVLLVHEQPKLAAVIESCNGPNLPLKVVHAATLAKAREALENHSFDVAMIHDTLPDGDGLALADELVHSRRLIEAIVLAEQADGPAAIRAMQAGASDLITDPARDSQLADRLGRVVCKQQSARNQAKRIRRLRRLCKKLNEARIEISEQVDALCSDLVSAYQELAEQFNQVVQTTEYSTVIKDELDLESLLRKTLEHLVEKAGSTNAAIFLPASMDEFSLGGYVNYDCSADAADMLLQHLADVLAPKVSTNEQPIHIDDNKTLRKWIGDDWAYLEDSDLLSFAARHEDETLAVITLFRDGSQPFDPDLVESVGTIGQLLGEALARLIRIHHRHLPDGPFMDEDDSDEPIDDLPFDL